jgi:hypothetical protein
VRRGVGRGGREGGASGARRRRRRPAGRPVAPALQRVRVDHHVARLGRGHLPVREGAADRHRRVGRLALAQVVEDQLAALRAEPPLQPGEEHRAPRLVAAALAEELVLERVDGVDVVPRPRPARAVDRAQLRVDPRGVDVDVVQQPPPRRPARRTAAVCLAASVCALGTKVRSPATSAIALRFGASIAATRESNRACSSNSPRSSAVIQPAVNVGPSTVFAVMCGTSKRSRTTRTPLRGPRPGMGTARGCRSART